MREIDPISVSPENAVDETKKTYEKPQVIYSSPLEAMASVCKQTASAKISAGFGGCSTSLS
jgi:hypothetical protein